MSNDLKVILATSILATAFAVFMYYAGITKWLMDKL